MDAAALIYKTASGKLESILSENLDPLIDVAKRARVEGRIGKTKIERGVVLASWRNVPAYRFICQPPEPMAVEKD
jgi:hypothetical protein